MSELYPVPLWPGGVTAGVQVPAAQHTYTAACDGFHAPGPCPLLSPPAQAAASAELAAAMAESRLLRELVREICDTLHGQKYPPARTAKWRQRAGLEG